MDTQTETAKEKVNPVKPSDLIYGVEDRPPFKDAFFAALQHLLAISVLWFRWLFLPQVFQLLFNVGK